MSFFVLPAVVAAGDPVHGYRSATRGDGPCDRVALVEREQLVGLPLDHQGGYGDPARVRRRAEPSSRPPSAPGRKRSSRFTGVVHADLHVQECSSGRCTRKVAPLPGAESTSALPPWALATAATMASPRPTPSFGPSSDVWTRAREASTR